ncbi:thermostable hemolysin [Aestuariicella sp. G3-2]|uniref:thermostable hemolysin n=1 Tax=Pseudomaricurvus albidus TaxID=2842452 RepID=UPI001C0D4683|nr:thermostable hemolysin [Aestuariicella albida]MBU3070720.1 thermostable hemolysin [Aestuariicella albida]
MHSSKCSIKPRFLTQSEPKNDENRSSFALQGLSDSQRQETEAYIARQYLKVYDAHIRAFLPLLLSMSRQSNTSRNRELSGVVGLRPALVSRLFLEAYLDQPVEQAVAKAASAPVDRGSIVEVGNLVATQRGSSLVLFLVMAAIVERAGFSWLVFTATPEVEKLIKRLTKSPTVLAPAPACRLGSHQDDWGRYYQQCPKVMALDVVEAIKNVREVPLLQQVLLEHEDAIDDLASQVLRHRRQEDCRAGSVAE